MRGRPPKSNARKRLTGTDQKCRMREETPPSEPLSVEQISSDLAVFPTSTGITHVEGLLTERARKIYEMRCKSLAALGIMDASYQDQMILYARWLDIALTAAEQIDNDAMYVTSFGVGGIKYTISPHLEIFKMATKMVNSIGQQFGFTAISHNNIKKAEKEINPVEELQKIIEGK